MNLNEFIIKKENQLKEINEMIKSHEEEVKLYLKRDLKSYNGRGILESYLKGINSLNNHKEIIEQDLKDLNN